MASLDLHEQPTATVLAHYNELRIAKGQQPLEQWKESKTKLLDAIARIDPVDSKPAAAHTKREAVKTESTPKKPKDDTVFTLAGLARDFNIDPKVLRAKGRRHGGELMKLKIEGDSWEFPTSARAQVIKVLKLEKAS